MYIHIPYNGKLWRGLNLAKRPPDDIGTNFKFGGFNAVLHTHACVNYYWRVFNLAIFQKIRQIAKVSCYTVYIQCRYLYSSYTKR